MLTDNSLDKAVVARMLSLPSVEYLSELSDEVDPQAIFTAREFVADYLAQQLQTELLACYQDNQKPYAYSAKAIARRALKNVCLQYLMRLDNKNMLTVCKIQLKTSDNMTDTSAALNALVNSCHSGEANTALSEFYRRWEADALVLDQWFVLQASAKGKEALGRIKSLEQHPAFSMTNPNKVRSLIGVFASRNLAFHDESGSGYAYLADKVLELNGFNPQIAARLVTPLTRWKKFKSNLSVLMRKELERIQGEPELSKDVYEVVSKSLAV